MGGGNGGRGVLHWIGCSGEIFVNQNSQSGFIWEILYNFGMKKLFIFIFVLFFMALPIWADGGLYQKNAVYDLQGNKILSLPDVSIYYYSPRFVVVRDNDKNFYITDCSGKRLDERMYRIFNGLLAGTTNGNFVMLYDKPIDDNDGNMIVYNANGDVVFPLDKISHYEPLGFKYLKDGRMYGINLHKKSVMIFEANKTPLYIRKPDDLAAWINESGIDTRDFSDMTDEEKASEMEKILGNWFNDDRNVYCHNMSDNVVFQTRDGAGIRSRQYPTKVIVRPNPQYQQIIVQGDYFAYYCLGKWGVKSMDDTISVRPMFSTVPRISGGYIYAEE